MFLRIDKLQIELPRPTEADPQSAGIVQDLMGDKFGEMSTLMNYTYKSFNMRGKSKMRPYYDLIANIAAEEMGHIELVANTINLLLDKTVESADGAVPPLTERGRRHGQPRPLHQPRAGHHTGWRRGCEVDRRLRLQLRQPQARPVAQRLPRVRGSYGQDPGLRDDRQPGGARDDRVPHRARRRPPGGLRQGALRPLRRGHHQAPAGAGDRQHAIPARQEVHRPGLSPDPVPLQPRGLQADLGDLERLAGRHRRRTRGHGWPARGRRGAGPHPDTSDVRPGVNAEDIAEIAERMGN